MDFGTNIRRIREEKGIKANYVAEKIGITPSMYCDIEKNRKRLTAELSVLIADALGVSIEDLLRPHIRETRIGNGSSQSSSNPKSA